MGKSIEFIIAEDGKVSLEVNGCTDPEECKILTQPFERALGTVTDSTVKPQFYQELDKTELYGYEE